MVNFRIGHWLFLVLLFAGANLYARKEPSGFAGQANLGYRQRIAERLEKKNPQLVLLGNSVLGHSIDEEIFSEKSGINTYLLQRQGTGSTVWYLVFKHIIAKAQVKPQTVALFFRETELTDPSFRTAGKYMKQIKALADFEEPLVEKLTYSSTSPAQSRWLKDYVPLVRLREVSSLKAEKLVKTAASSLSGMSLKQIDSAVAKTFSAKQMDAQLFTSAQQNVEAVGESNYNFAERMPDSYLPGIIELAKANNIHLAFVRAKKRSQVGKERQVSSGNRSRYIEDLAAYLDSEGMNFYDFSREERISLEHYADGDHLNPRGKKVFTEIFAEAVLKKPILAAHPNQVADFAQAKHKIEGATP